MSLEPDQFEQDSAYGEELSTYSASLTSSAYNFPESHGRKYHSYKAGRYFMPNDDQEIDRLDVHYALVRRIMDGKLNLAPIADNIERAIDLGTGTGLWAINFADKHEKAYIIGNDLSPIQPGWVPANVKFLIDDIEAPWGYEQEPFDYVHACLLIGAIKDFPKLMRQTFTCTKPGGWAEFQDWDIELYSQDDTYPQECALRKWDDLVIEGIRASGSEPHLGMHLEQWMKDAGFVDVTAVKTPVPVGNWPKDKLLKEMGVLNHIQLSEALEAVSLGTMINMGWTYDEIQTFLVDVRNDLNSPAIHTIYDFYIVYGRKPE
ncbi:uncharacterized protein HMPREF1541_09664 [Cyphellophora europaea CBS 101466]|uniref:Methyltransferase domain-containing protein n=1 Tax=Cyphellophora europaea (strain CBS 101466) TaxID=1220924 RepID=W2SA52_CYPE1|nr:uncharacterized protein HMPREF1541_09664 [Cyphellophora europaea CBS 101466]ETN44789.1 hypothetical protein HMPREF1541_09664 [Cyphellophora europaea CBS 101466]